MGDIQRVVTSINSPFETVTYAGQVNAVQISGCIDDFISVVHGTHDFVACVSSSARATFCGAANPGFIVIPAIPWECPTVIDISWTWDGFGGVSTRQMTFKAVGPFTLTVSNNGDPGAVISSSPAGISCGGDCNEDFAKNTIVTLTAVPGPGHAFVDWTVDDPLIGGGPFLDNPLVLTMDRNWGLTANYIETLIVIGDGRARFVSPNVVEAIPAPNNYLVGIICPP